MSTLSSFLPFFQTGSSFLGGLPEQYGNLYGEEPGNIYERFNTRRIGLLDMIQQAIQRQSSPEQVMGAYQGGLQDLLNYLGPAEQQLFERIGGMRSNAMNNLSSAYGGVLESLGQSGQQAIQALQGARGDVLGRLDERTAQAGQSLADLIAGTRSGYEDLRGTARQRMLDILQGSGEQEKKDIERQFGRVAGATRSDLLARGMLGSVGASSSLEDVNRQRQDALGRLEERLRGQRLGVEQMDVGLGQQEIQSLRDLGLSDAQIQAALSGEAAGASERFGGLESGLLQAIGQAKAGAQERQAGTSAGLEQFFGGLAGQIGQMFPQLQTQSRTQLLTTLLDILGRANQQGTAAFAGAAGGLPGLLNRAPFYTLEQPYGRYR